MRPAALTAYDERSALTTLARRYRIAAGEAYARGDDADARRYRDAAEDLERRAPELPEMPPVKG